MSDIIYIIISVGLSTASILLFKRTRKTFKHLLAFLFFFSIFLLLLCLYFVSDYFTGSGITIATIFHLIYGLGGAGYLEYKWLIISTVFLFFSGLFAITYFIKSPYHKHKRPTSILLPYSLIILSILSSPAGPDLYNVFSEPRPAVDFYTYYQKPNLTALSDSTKNIIFIYAESLEQTYFDERRFPGLIKELRELESHSTCFTNINQVAGTEWTVAGLTASMGGIPLFVPLDGRSISNMDRFLPNAVLFSDLLKEAGYNLTYLGGADLDFGGKGKLFKSHGFNEVWGKKELAQYLDDPTYQSGWGLYDDTLFDLAFDRFLSLSSAGTNFGLFLLTLDTHHPNGIISESCRHIKYLAGDNPILNAVASSDHLITKFINQLLQSPFSDQSIIVLVSDHLAMQNTASDLLDGARRRNLFMIIEPGKSSQVNVNTKGSMLDVSPTVLPFIGFSGQIGLGRNLMDIEKSQESDISHIHQNLDRWKRSIYEFWNSSPD
ncbi:MAG: sulfatase-like hydrolase/transferase [Candidatus Marinimicrobia bacterium]|nr:sulfatase-like hydrolase/transferase [Candidatus Neomarinimicrobiota bacterium]